MSYESTVSAMPWSRFFHTSFKDFVLSHQRMSDLTLKHSTQDDGTETQNVCDDAKYGGF